MNRDGRDSDAPGQSFGLRVSHGQTGKLALPNVVVCPSLTPPFQPFILNHCSLRDYRLCAHFRRPLR